ncbi:MAG: hypothetical protein LE180_04550 [Endomicrobium sp.]|nr:hypothetical protein [Endomicrobium sp.]
MVSVVVSVVVAVAEVAVAEVAVADDDGCDEELEDDAGDDDIDDTVMGVNNRRSPLYKTNPVASVANVAISGVTLTPFTVVSS